MNNVNVENRLYKSVDANSIETMDYVIPDGQVLEIRCLAGDAGESPDNVVSIVWDEGGGSEEILMSVHGDTLQPGLSIKKTGDGIKKLRIKLQNDKNVADLFGGFWMGILYG